MHQVKNLLCGAYFIRGEYMNSTLTVKPQRNYGIDLLRIISMLLIVGQHVFFRVLNINSFYGAHNILVWVMYLACACPVNCYALISGYVGVKKNIKPQISQPYG